MADEKHELDTIVGIIAACGRRTPREQLDILSITWLIVANNARTEALIQPGGFLEERLRQGEELRRMAALIASTEPDLEMERMSHEGDFEGMLKRARELRDEDEKGGA